MILVGQYDSPFVRRVAISLLVLEFPFEQDTRSVFADFDEMRRVNPLGRIPSLVLDSGETLIDSFAILDWLDREVGAERALVPQAGPARTRAMQIIALAAGAIEKFGAVNYEEIIRPAPHRWHRLDRALPDTGAGRAGSAGAGGLAETRAPGPGANHEWLPAGLSRAFNADAAYAGALSQTSRVLDGLHGEAGVRGHPSRRIRGAPRLKHSVR